MSEPKLVALYPHPADIEKFNRDYENHTKLLHEKLQLPVDAHPYTITRFFETPLGKPAFYQMFVFNFPSIEVMQRELSSPAWQALSEDAFRVSSGGPPIFLIGA